MRGKWLLIGGTAVLVVIASGALSLLRRAEYRAAAGRPASSKSPPGAFLGPEVSLPGKVYAQHVVAVGVPMDGTLEFVGAQPGEEVYEGQLLARIKNLGLETAQQVTAAQAERAQSRLELLNSNYVAARLEASRAQADASRARSEYERAEKVYLRQQMLNTEQATARLVFEKAQKEFELAREQFQSLDELARQTRLRVDALRKEGDNARRLVEDSNRELEDVKQNLASAEIHSPVDGLLLSRAKQAGDEVDRDLKDLFQIAVDLSALEAWVEPEPPVLERLQRGQQAVIMAAELGDQGIPGNVREVKLGQAIVEFTSPGPAVRPGVTVQVRIKLR